MVKTRHLFLRGSLPQTLIPAKARLDALPVALAAVGGVQFLLTQIQAVAVHRILSVFISKAVSFSAGPTGPERPFQLLTQLHTAITLEQNEKLVSELGNRRLKCRLCNLTAMRWPVGMRPSI